MKNNGLIFVLLFSLSCLFFSCSGPDYSAEIKTLDSLKVQVGIAKKEFAAMDTLKIEEMTGKSEKNISIIKNLFQPGDTLNMETGQRVTAYKGFRKAKGKITGMRKTLWSEFSYTERQLEALLKDLQEKTVNKDSVQVYLKAETQATLMLLSSYDFYRETHEQALKDFDSLNPLIEDLIRTQELKREAGNNK